MTDSSIPRGATSPPVGPDAGPDTKFTGPANTLDLTVLRAWLAQPVGEPDEDGTAYTLAVDMGIGDGLTVTATNEVTSLLDDVLIALRGDDEQDAWTLAPGIEHIDVRRTYSDGCNDGVDVHVDLNNGVRLCSLHRDHKELTGGAEDPLEAIVNAVAEVAYQANRVVATYRAATGADATIVGREVFVAGDESDERFTGLMQALNLRGPLRFSDGWVDAGETRARGVRFDRQYDLDKVVAYAAEHGLRYVDERTTNFDSGN